MLLLIHQYQTATVTVSASVSTSKLQVHIPQSLSQKDGYDHRDALFGIPPYGGSIQEKLYYADDTLCGPTVDSKAGYPVEKDADGNLKAWQSPFILMVDRGDCTFVQKVRNAQRAGAAAVLIADSVCLCGATDCDFGPEQDICETEEPIMADDGSGADISIPSFLIFKQDADKIKAVVVQNQPVRIEMSFSVPAPDSRVEYDLWTTPADAVSVPFLQTFREAALALDSEAYFTPHMYIYDGNRAGCHIDDEDDGENFCEGLCTNGGRYCATDPDGDFDAGISGADVVRESLRRICIWNSYGKDDGIGQPWWDYVEEFIFRCNDPDHPEYFTKDDCIADAMKHAKVDKTIVDNCMRDSGGLEEDKPNGLFESSLSDKESAGAFLIPSLFVNQAPIRGVLSFSTVFRAVCAGYAAGSEPKVCQACANCHNEEQCVKDGKCKSGHDSTRPMPQAGVSSTTFGASLLIVSLLFITAGFIVYQRQQRHMRDEIRGIMAEYTSVPLSSHAKEGESTAVSDDYEESEFVIS